jgi:hypothetical protein
MNSCDLGDFCIDIPDEAAKERHCILSEIIEIEVWKVDLIIIAKNNQSINPK